MTLFCGMQFKCASVLGWFGHSGHERDSGWFGRSDHERVKDGKMEMSNENKHQEAVEIVGGEGCQFT